MKIKKDKNNNFLHSIIIGDDGGMFALLNSVSDEEEFIKSLQNDVDYWEQISITKN